MMNDNDDHPKVAAKTVAKTARAVEHQSRKVADSAHEIKQSSARVEDSAERTTRLAADRTILAAERTYAAWVRTGLFSLASGIGARALLTGLMPEWLVLADATVLVIFSVFCFGAAVWRQLHPGPPPSTPDVKQLPRFVLLTVNVFLALVSVAALVGIWSAPVMPLDAMKAVAIPHGRHICSTPEYRAPSCGIGV
jgi:putative membrane protein